MLLCPKLIPNPDLGGCRMTTTARRSIQARAAASGGITQGIVPAQKNPSHSQDENFPKWSDEVSPRWRALAKGGALPRDNWPDPSEAWPVETVKPKGQCASTEKQQCDWYVEKDTLKQCGCVGTESRGHSRKPYKLCAYHAAAYDKFQSLG